MTRGQPDHPPTRGGDVPTRDIRTFHDDTKSLLYPLVRRVVEMVLEPGSPEFGRDEHESQSV